MQQRKELDLQQGGIAMPKSINPADKASIEEFKRQARKIKKSNPGMKHHEALDRVAQDHGYADWRHARAVLAPDNDESEDV